MFLDLTVIGLAITLEPIPLTAFILTLGTERGLVNGLAFILAWLASFVLILAIVFAATGNHPPRPHTAPSVAASSIRLAIGAGLIVIGLRQRRHIGRPHKPATWMTRLDRLKPLTSAGLAFLVQPWGLIAAGAVTLVEAKVNSVWSYLALVYFCLLSTSTIISLELYAVLRPETAREKLHALRRWIDTHRDLAIVVLSIGVGLWLVGKAVFQLVSGYSGSGG